jgi:hypothetical protein
MDHALQTLRYLKQLSLPRIAMSDVPEDGSANMLVLMASGYNAFGVSMDRRILRDTRTLLQRLRKDEDYKPTNLVIINTLLDYQDHFDFVQYEFADGTFGVYVSTRTESPQHLSTDAAQTPSLAFA